MAKLRVYELARELDLESRKLVEKLNAAGMDIKNYMIALDEDTVAKARAIVARAVSEVVEEKRIKPTIIRRRKKVVEPEPDLAPAPTLSEEPKEESVPELAEIEAELVSEVEEAAPVDVPETLETPLEPEAEVTVLSQEETVPLEEQESAISEVEVEPEIPAEPAAKAEPEKPAVETTKPPKKPKSKKLKKRRMDEPAKIIKLPEEGPLKDVLGKKAEQETPKPAPAPGPIPATRPQALPVEPQKETTEEAKKEKPAKRKKVRKKAEEEDAKDKVAPKRRKKEVYERADLYDSKPARAKTRVGGKRIKESPRRHKQTEITVPRAIKRRIKVQGSVSVTDLAKAMGTKATQLIRVLMGMGVMANINQPLDFEAASLAADELGFELEMDTFQEGDYLAKEEERREDLTLRPPVVTIMGHVDHGKTSLLDYIRQSKIIEGEFGGITQHIGAYYVNTERGDVVFLDTPGHEAFTAMRARGAKVTDLVVLVVAADDGVMPQTREAVNHARAASIPIVVAINKIDKHGADPDRVRREMADLGLTPEEWGGDTLFASISAKTGQGVDDLLSLLLLQAEMLELRGNPTLRATGSVVEAELDKAKGPVATVLIKNGTLRQGDQFVCGEYFGRVRAMLDHLGRRLDTAGPSTPVKLYGISGVPMAGDEFLVVQDEKTAKQIMEYRKSVSKKPEATRKGLVSLDDLFDRIREGDVKELNIVLKADVQGSAEALSESLLKQSTDRVKLNIIHAAAGAITESDIMLASASNAIVIGFNVRTNPRVSEIAEKEHVDVRYYEVIYNAIEDVRMAMTGLLEPLIKENVIGHTEVRETFRVPKVGTVAGCQVMDGRVERNASVRLLRDNVVVFDGRISSLRRFKEDVKEVQTGYECGISLENFNDIKPGDILEVYQKEKVAAEL